MTLVISSTFLFERPKVPSCCSVSVCVLGYVPWVERMQSRIVSWGRGKTYPLLSQTTGTLVLGVSEQFNDALLVGGKTVDIVSVICYTGNCAVLRLSKLQNATYPATSLVISRTKAVRLDRKPFLLEILGAGVLGVTSVRHVSVHPTIFFISVVAVPGRRERCAGETYCGRR